MKTSKRVKIIIVALCTLLNSGYILIITIKIPKRQNEIFLKILLEAKFLKDAEKNFTNRIRPHIRNIFQITFDPYVLWSR